MNQRSRSRLVLLGGSILGGALFQVAMLACGSVPGSSIPDAALGGGDALAADGPQGFQTPVWSSYTPTITSDGSTIASTLVRGGTIRYVQLGTTVCLQGEVVIGEQSSGVGGTFIKVSVPPGLPGATSVHQYGIGHIERTGDATTLFAAGSAAIEDDANDFILAKNSDLYFTDGDARPGAGIVWTASGCYQTN